MRIRHPQLAHNNRTSMTQYSTYKESPLISETSFHKIFESLERIAGGPKSVRQKCAQAALDELAEFPALREGFRDPELMNTYKPQIDLLMSNVFPEALATNEIKAAVAPMNFTPFHTSTRFQNILNDAGPDFKFEMDGFTPDLFYVVMCTMILAAYYQRPVDLKRSWQITIPAMRAGGVKHYKIAYNADLMDIVPNGKKIEITDQIFERLINNIHDVALWKSVFPPESFIVRGIAIMNMMDITIDQSVADVTTNLLQRTNDSLDKIESNLRSLMGIPDLRMAVTGYMEDGTLRVKPGMHGGLMMDGAEKIKVDDVFCDGLYGHVIKGKQPLALSNIPHYAEVSESTAGKNLLKAGIGSYAMYPLIVDDELVAVVELGSPRKFELNSGTILKLESVIPMLSMAARQFAEEKKIRIEAIIQEECTTIHPSVKWRFEEEACKYMEDEQSGLRPHFNDIVFRDVYPLYGQLDIRGSSTLRNKAVEKDLSKQLKNVRKVLKAAMKKQKMPILDELNLRVGDYLGELASGIGAGAEHKILTFLQEDVYPVFKHLEQTSETLHKAVEKYRASLDPNLHIVYEERRDFDDSVMATNMSLASFIDRKQHEAQKMFPHYFERYKTDGVEYNMFIGQSLVQKEKHQFDPMYLENLRLWQLIVMCEMENEFQELRKTLKTPLQVASLILVNSSSLAIHFRLDEKRFDVDGAYNARYEIIKKRVDKALIKGTNERLTQPGKIAIIYTQEQDAREYDRYINYLKAKGLVEDAPIEYVDVDDLPGVNGLKAMRVNVRYADKLAAEANGFSNKVLQEALERSAEAEAKEKVH